MKFGDLIGGLLGGNKPLQRLNAVPQAEMRPVLDAYNGQSALDGGALITEPDWRRFEAIQREWLLGKLAKKL